MSNGDSENVVTENVVNETVATDLPVERTSKVKGKTTLVRRPRRIKPLVAKPRNVKMVCPGSNRRTQRLEERKGVI